MKMVGLLVIVLPIVKMVSNMKLTKFPLLILLLVFAIVTTSGVFASWHYSNNLAVDNEADGSVGVIPFVYDNIVITKVTTVTENLTYENSNYVRPTNVKSTLSGSAGQSVVYKVDAYNFSQTQTYILAGPKYDSGAEDTLNKLTISLSQDEQNLKPINANPSNNYQVGTPVAPNEKFTFYVTYTLTENVYSGEFTVNYSFEPVIYTVTYLNNNETYVVDYVTNNSTPYNVRSDKPQNSSFVFAGWVNVNAVVLNSIPAYNTNDYTLTASWENVYVIIFADVNGNVLYEEQFTSSSTKLSTQGQATVDQILAELNAEASKEQMSVSWSEYEIKGAKSDITVKAIYAYNGDLNLVPVYEQPDDGIVDYYKVVAVDTLPENVVVPGSVGGVPVKIVERIANTEGENDWNNYAGNVKNITIAEGVERLEWNSLAWTPNLSTVKLPSTLKYLAKNTFSRNDLFGNDKKKLTIEFNGTKEQWKVLVSNSDSAWAGGLTDGSVVKCSDGYFELDKGLFSSSWKEKSY